MYVNEFFTSEPEQKTEEKTSERNLENYKRKW